MSQELSLVGIYFFMASRRVRLGMDIASASLVPKMWHGYCRVGGYVVLDVIIWVSDRENTNSVYFTLVHQILLITP